MFLQAQLLPVIQEKLTSLASYSQVLLKFGTNTKVAKIFVTKE
jgi:hypothetical protein